MKRREQLIMVGVVAVVALGAFYLGLLSPKIKESKSLGKTLTAVQARRTQAIASAAAAQAAQGTYVSNVTTIASLTPAIPPTDSTSPLLRALNAAAVKTHVDFTTITLTSTGGGSAGPSKPIPGAPAGATTPAIPPGYTVSSPAGIPSVSYSLKFQGGYLKMQQFLSALEHFVSVRNGTVTAHDRLLDVQGVSVAAGAVTMSVTGYLLSPSDQTPLPVPQNAPAVPGVEPASTSAPVQKPTKVAASGGAHS